MSAWKACDLRGKYPSEVNGDLFYAVGRSAARLLTAGSDVLVAGDYRLSTTELKTRLIRGLQAAGVRILDAGSVPTPAAYHAHRTLQTAALFIVTASHNPSEFNGLKLMVGHEPPDEALFSALRKGLTSTATASLGHVEPCDVIPAYRAWIADRWRAPLQNFHAPLVIDVGHGAMAGVAAEVFDALGLPCEVLFPEADGHFPDRAPDPSRAANLTALSRSVRQSGAALGLAWDGDGDRVAAVDGNGKYITADRLAILLIRKMLAGRPGERVVYDIKLSDAVRRAIEDAGGVPLIERSGHSFIKHRMRKENAIFGCEASGHYFYRELAGGDDGLFTALAILELTLEYGPLAPLVQSLPPIFATPDLRIPASVLPFEEVARRLGPALNILSVETIDGVRFRTPEGIVLARPSVTEAATSVRIEGNSQTDLTRLITRAVETLGECVRSQLGSHEITDPAEVGSEMRP